MKEVDYSRPPPRSPTLLPPPAKRGVATFVIPTTILLSIGLLVYIYYTADDETYEFYRALEAGEIPGDNDDDDEDDDDDDEEEFEIDGADIDTSGRA